MNKTKKGSSVAERTLKALMLFSEHKYLAVSEIAESLEISLTAAYRLTETLHDTGFIKREASKKYTLDAPNILQLYSMVEQDIRKASRPIIKMLANKLNESVYLSIIHNDKHYIYIEKEDSPSHLKWTVDLGNLHTLPTGSAGKTHFAYLIKDFNNQERHAFISQYELTKYTESSLVTTEDLIESIQNILQDGYCFTKGEHLRGVVGISVPVFNFQDNNVIAVLSVFMADSRFDKHKLDDYVSSLKDGAMEIGKYIS